jgi:tetratricopeptide (TPR) repeat protein
VAPTALVALAGFAVWHHHVQRERIAAEVMAKARGYEADSDWERAAECYRDLAHWQTSPVEANYRQVCVSLQAASSRDDRRQAFLQLEGILQRAPLHVGVLRTHLNLALELDKADAAVQSAERLYLIDRHQAATLQMCAETRLRFASEPSALPAITAESLSSWIDRLGQVSTWRDDLVIEIAAICCQQPGAVDRSLVNAIQAAVCDAADRQQTARAHFASWQFEHAFGGPATSLARARGCLDEARGCLDEARGCLDEARGCLDEARGCLDEDCPRRVAYEIYLASAKQAWQASEPDEAKAFAVAAIREISTDHRSYELLGDVYESQREWGRCAAAYLRAWRLAGDRPLEIGIKLAESLVRVGRHAESSSLVNGLVRQVDDPLISPDRRLRIRLRLVQTQLDVRAERYEAALQELQRCNALAKLLPPQADPSGELLHAIEVLRAQCLVRLGRYADAARLFEARAGRVDSPADQWTAAARAWTKGGNVSAAERCYRRAVAESANDPRVWLEYVQHLKASRGIDEAVAEVTKRQGRVGLEAPVSDRSLAQAWEIGLLQRVVAAEPHNVVVANNLAMLLADEAKEFEQALQCIDRVLERTGPVAEFLDTKGWILLQMDRAAEAIPWLTEATARAYSADPVAQLHLAAAYMVTGDRDRAREYLESATGGQLRAELLNTSEQHAWQALQREFSPQVLTSVGGEA